MMAPFNSKVLQYQSSNIFFKYKQKETIHAEGVQIKATYSSVSKQTKYLIIVHKKHLKIIFFIIKMFVDIKVPLMANDSCH